MRKNKIFGLLTCIGMVGIIIGLFSNHSTLPFYIIWTILFFVLYYQTKNKIQKESGKKINDCGELSPVQDNSVYENHHVAGTSYRKDAISSLGFKNRLYDSSVKELKDIGFGPNDEQYIYEYEFDPNKNYQVELLEEPNNLYDNNALKVLINDIHVGCIKKASCAHIKKLLKEEKIIIITAKIKDGPYKYVEFEDGEIDKISLYADNSFSIILTFKLRK